MDVVLLNSDMSNIMTVDSPFNSDLSVTSEMTIFYELTGIMTDELNINSNII